MPPSERVQLLLWEVFLVVFINSKHHYVSGLEVQQIFKSADPTNNFAVNEVSNKVYLASVNRIYQLDGNLSLEIEEKTGPVLDNMLCHAPQLPHASCEHPKVLTDNYNKLLQLDRDQHVVVVCGSVYQGFCELRKLENVSEIAVEFPPQGDHKVTVFPSMLNIAANHPNASTVGLILRSSGGNTRLLVGATYTGVGTAFFPKNHSKEDLRFENTPEIAIRSLNVNELSRLFTYDINPSEDNVFKIKQEVKPKNKLSFVQAFIQKTYSYIAMNNDANLGEKESQPNSILARICLDNKTKRKECKKLTESYIQMGLQCGSDGSVFNRLLSVFSARVYLSSYLEERDLLFGVFEKSNKKSALCVFQFSDIESSIRNARKTCLNETNSGDVSVLDSVIQGTGAGCVKKNIVLQSEHLDCGAAHLQHPLALRNPLKASPVFESSGLTAVAVASVNDHTIVFLGTATGRLQKLNLLKNLTLGSQKAIRVASRESVHHIMSFDPSDNNYLYLMTSHQMIRVKVAKCDQYKTCNQCLGAVDAYCGWCTLESRCSLQRECTDWKQPHFWISLSEGIDMCPSMTITPSEINLASNFKVPVVGILINGSVPDLNRTKVECDYGNGVSTEATVYGIDSAPSQIHSCPFLPKEKYPEFPPGQDHVTIRTTIKVNGMSIVWGNVTIYDCERTGMFNAKTACTSCLNTKWKCYWNVKTYACVSSNLDSKDLLEDSASCPKLIPATLDPIATGTTQDIIFSLANTETLQDSASCPKLIPATLDPIATGTTQDIIFSLANTETLQGTGLQCCFGNDQFSEVSWADPITIICHSVKLYTTENSQQIPVHLRLKEHPDKFIDSPIPMTVEVYNCMSGSTDCSQCWGREDRGHRCVWCENSCRMRSECKAVQESCSAPEIRKIDPLSGPLEGGTLLTIQGRNLGRRFSDITVSIGGVGCRPLQDRYIVSEVIVCETEKAPAMFSDVVSVIVGTEGKSRETFSYLNPEVTSIEPNFGPKAGGTKVIISGKNLDVGSRIRVLVNGTKECTSLLRTQDTIKCTMPAALLPKAETVQVCVQFEGNPCPSSSNSTMYTYMENPVISEISPKTSHVSGGRILTLKGQEFNLIQNISMVVLRIGKEPTICAVQSPTVITCPSPAASNNTEEQPVKFYINGVLYTGDGSAVHSLPDYDDESHTGSFYMHYCEDPHFYIANKERWIKHHHGEPLTLVIMNINVSFQGCGMDSLTVRVMNTDTICQVKEKILEAFYKNLPFSQWPRAEDLDLEWFASSNDSRILRDLDDTTLMEDGRKKLNTVLHYKVPEEASLAISLKDKRDNTLGRVKDLDTEKYFHLVLPNDELMENKKSHRQGHRKKVLPEIYLTRLLSTKGTLQKFLDDLFQAILSIPEDKPPFAVKYFFDFLEEQADKRGITDPDTLHIWKTNSLPLRFWVNILKNPQFVFDIDKTDHMDACLSVIAQAFIDACSISDLQLGKDSPTNKLLYAKEIPEYKKTVQRYYQQIQEMMPLSEQEMNAHLAEESRKYRNEFNTNSALAEIYKYAKRYQTQVVNALEANPTTKRTQLQHKFQQVIALVEDNIYECSSEA
ncbi:Plexin-D1 [Acipenser ruthenus]|uniref:Plexin-D1 n=1 Tax=Acipenser ruthenus TaxID=7906 RepID=A0A662YNR2_ACIRT|nr:Plexin-D1 [Acipenser ruthenus]